MKKYFNFFSKAVRRMKLKLHMHAYDINLYNVCVFSSPEPKAHKVSLEYSSRAGVRASSVVVNIFKRLLL